MAVETARLLSDDQIPPLGVDAGPYLIDAWSVGDLTADLRLLDVVDHQLRGLHALGQIGIQEAAAGGVLVVDAGGTLLLGREPGLDERAERPPPFVVPEFAPGDFPFC